MKKIVTYLISTLLLTVSTNAASQVVREIKGIESFTKISLASGVNLILNKADQRAVRVEAERSVVPHVICRVAEDGELQIFTTKFRYKSSKRINVYVDYDSTIVRIDAPSGNRVRAENPIETDRIELVGRNGCDFYINLICKRVKVKCTNGTVVKLLGSAEQTDLFVENSSQIRAYDLTSRNTLLTATIASRIELTATESLTGTATNDCEVFYKGNPKDFSLQLGSGSKAFAQ